IKRPEGLYFFIYFGNFIKNNDKIQKNKPITLYEQPVCLQSETFENFSNVFLIDDSHFYQKIKSGYLIIFYLYVKRSVLLLN
ncbi:hypothetical protein ACODH6_11565, partial [Vagococcus fluvialis]|uniref:hypothetical protein n=1 Tax=Vagococcus fluvialis TaxID=2738 RepID=UPI003B5CEC32